jgi:Ras homolog gene family, member A
VSPPSGSRGGAEISFKIVVVGMGACGKTCTLITFSKGRLPEVYVPTVFENYVAGVEVDHKHLELALWDTAGQEDYDRLRPLSYPDCHIVIISYAIDSPDSLDDVVEKWIHEVSHFCKGVPILLVGMKQDLRWNQKTIEELRKTSRRPTSYAEGLAVAKKIGAAAFVECSAMTNEGISQTFEAATRLCLRARKMRVRQSRQDCSLM